MIADVRVDPRVTPLAMLHIFPSGVQPQASRHALIDGASNIEALFKKKAANRGYAPDAANVFNAIGIKANSAFMPTALNPQPP